MLNFLIPLRDVEKKTARQPKLEQVSCIVIISILRA